MSLPSTHTLELTGAPLSAARDCLSFLLEDDPDFAVTRLALRRCGDNVQVSMAFNGRGLCLDDSYCEILKIGLLRNEGGVMDVIVLHDARFDDQQLYQPMTQILERMAPRRPGDIVLHSVVEAFVSSVAMVRFDGQRFPQFRVTHFRRQGVEWSFDDVTGRVADFLVDGDTVQVRSGRVVTIMPCTTLIERLDADGRVVTPPVMDTYILGEPETLTRIKPPDEIGAGNTPYIATWPRRGITKWYFDDGRIVTCESDNRLSYMDDVRRPGRVIGIISDGDIATAVPVARGEIGPFDIVNDLPPPPLQVDDEPDESDCHLRLVPTNSGTTPLPPDDRQPMV